MSSDGATDKPRSSRLARGDGRGAAQIALAVLLVLALVATVVMIFSDDAVWMRVGTLAALWAAFIGAFLVARYRRQAAAEAARVRDLHTVYELQLEREISARREHELVVEKELRDSIRVETSDSIGALRQEIAALREQLGQLGVTLPEDRLAVGGGTAGELGAGSGLPSVPSERVQPRSRTSGAPAGPAAGVRREATPSTERTEKISPVAAEAEATREWEPEQRRGPAVRPVTRPQSAVDPSRAEPARGTATEPSRPEAAPVASEQTGASVGEGDRRDSRSAEEPARRERPTSTPAASRHGEGGGLSVAELMARLGDSAPRSAGRRHRSDD